jgi:hypothetical protein
MHCTLLVPDLPPPSAPDGAAARIPYPPALSRLLARSRRTALDAPGMESWLCQAFNVERQHDWPVAPLTLAADGVDPLSAYWLRCDPVHLSAQGRQLVLHCGHQTAPTSDETRELVTTLNAHFAQDGRTFHAPHPTRWYLRLEHTPSLVTHALPEVIGRDINRYLPGGNDGMHWHHALNEIQMLLHMHPVNEAREARGAPAINSLWLWGGGVRPHVSGSDFTVVWSDDALAHALAAQSNLPHRAPPAHASFILDSVTTDAEKPLVILPQLRAAAHAGDADQWQAKFQVLERDWFAPLYAALRKRRLSDLTIIVPGADGGCRYDVTRRDTWKFWRRHRHHD